MVVVVVVVVVVLGLVELLQATAIAVPTTAKTPKVNLATCILMLVSLFVDCAPTRNRGAIEERCFRWCTMVHERSNVRADFGDS